MLKTLTSAYSWEKSSNTKPTLKSVGYLMPFTESCTGSENRVAVGVHNGCGHTTCLSLSSMLHLASQEDCQHEQTQEKIQIHNLKYNVYWMHIALHHGNV